jgi:hypothetical protein
MRHALTLVQGHAERCALVKGFAGKAVTTPWDRRTAAIKAIERHDFSNVWPDSGIDGLAPTARRTLSQCGSIAPDAFPKHQKIGSINKQGSHKEQGTQRTQVNLNHALALNSEMI